MLGAALIKFIASSRKCVVSYQLLIFLEEQQEGYKNIDELANRSRHLVLVIIEIVA